MEMRAGCMEYARGLITVISIFFLYFIAASEILSFLTFFDFFLDHDFSAFVAGLFPLAGACFFGWLYFKYGLQITRFEMLTQRRLLIRFNRKTRQIYLHRPKYA
ncbi:MAG: hypothetical protein RLN85_17470, partial [Pseudomonadales bacterium]